MHAADRPVVEAGDAERAAVAHALAQDAQRVRQLAAVVPDRAAASRRSGSASARRSRSGCQPTHCSRRSPRPLLIRSVPRSRFHGRFTRSPFTSMRSGRLYTLKRPSRRKPTTVWPNCSAAATARLDGADTAHSTGIPATAAFCTSSNDSRPDTSSTSSRERQLAFEQTRCRSACRARCADRRPRASRAACRRRVKRAAACRPPVWSNTRWRLRQLPGQRSDARSPRRPGPRRPGAQRTSISSSAALPQIPHDEFDRYRRSRTSSATGVRSRTVTTLNICSRSGPRQYAMPSRSSGPVMRPSVRHEPGRELEVVARRAHRHRERHRLLAGTGDPDLHRLLGDEPVGPPARAGAHRTQAPARRLTGRRTGRVGQLHTGPNATRDRVGGGRRACRRRRSCSPARRPATPPRSARRSRPPTTRRATSARPPRSATPRADRVGRRTRARVLQAAVDHGDHGARPGQSASRRNTGASTNGRSHASSTTGPAIPSRAPRDQRRERSRSGRFLAYARQRAHARADLDDGIAHRAEHTRPRAASVSPRQTMVALSVCIRRLAPPVSSTPARSTRHERRRPSRRAVSLSGRNEYPMTTQPFAVWSSITLLRTAPPSATTLVTTSAV